MITNAAITPGTQPISVRIKTIIKEPQPLSITASGGKIMHNNTLQIDIVAFFNYLHKLFEKFTTNLQFFSLLTDEQFRVE